MLVPGRPLPEFSRVPLVADTEVKVDIVQYCLNFQQLNETECDENKVFIHVCVCRLIICPLSGSTGVFTLGCAGIVRFFC